MTWGRGTLSGTSQERMREPKFTTDTCRRPELEGEFKSVCIHECIREREREREREGGGGREGGREREDY